MSGLIRPSSAIKSLQHINFAGATTVNVTIAAVDTAKSVIIFRGGTAASSSYVGVPMFYFTSSTQVTMNSAHADCQGKASIVEYY